MSKRQSSHENHRLYVSPRLFPIGEARKLILGVAGGGEDFMGFSRPDFEFQSDSPADPCDLPAPSAASTRTL